MSKGKKRLFILLALIIASTALMTLQYKGGDITFFRVLSYPFDFMSSVTTGVRDHFTALWNVKQENERLRKELTSLLLERQRFGEIVKENRRLTEILSLKDTQPRYLTTARVVARGYDRLLNTVILDKGASDGIRKDMAVLTSKGLAGKVYTVKPDSSEVLLLQDPNFSVAARLQEGREEGVVSGTGSRCVLKYVSPEVEVKPGTVVVSSGLDGIFPAGLPLGLVTRVKKEGARFFQDITIQPFQSDASVEEVVILGR